RREVHGVGALEPPPLERVVAVRPEALPDRGDRAFAVIVDVDEAPALGEWTERRLDVHGFGFQPPPRRAPELVVAERRVQARVSRQLAELDDGHAAAAARGGPR